MSAFEKSKSVEARSMAILLPFLQEKSHNGQFVVTSKGSIAKHLQEVVGDALMNTDSETVWSVEIKAEVRFTGNIFLETWSNRNLEDRRGHAGRGSNPGWFIKTGSDLLFYHFLDSDKLYIFDIFKLKQWAFRTPSKNLKTGLMPDDFPQRICDFPEKQQGKYRQMNDTRGRIVPIELLRNEGVPFKLLHPQQMTMAFADDMPGSPEAA